MNLVNLNNYYKNKNTQIEIKLNDTFIKNKIQLENDIHIYNNAVEQFEMEKKLHYKNVEQFEMEKKLSDSNINKIIEYINILPDKYDKHLLSNKIEECNKYKKHYKILINIKKHIKNQSKKYKMIIDILENNNDDESTDSN